MNNLTDVNDKYNTKSVHQVLLPMMRDFHDFCMNNDIRYSLAYGSLLGAVRHRGFIPWDDDLDVFMDRNNAQKFFSKMNEFKGYVATRELWTWRIRKEGNQADGYDPALDVFVIDNVPDGKLSRKMQSLKLKLLQGMLHERPDFSSGRYGFKQRIMLIITYLLGKLFSKKWKWKKYDAISSRYNGKKTQMQACFNATYRSIGVLFTSGLMDDIIVAPFESENFCIIKGYHENLTRTYGDYMTPPKEDERVPLHVC